ncbi:transposase family protein [Streptomyces sp. NPDC007896]|uniref:transposase family protein n=1 Tax=Streptomyces sp. NPDC007896 TaxID=3364784 RepID=UPI0036E4AD74
MDGAETQVRRPKANRPGRRAFVSGKKKQNTIKTTTISDGQGRLLWSGADRPGRMHDQTAMRTEGIAEQLRLRPKATAEVDEGYRGSSATPADARTTPRPIARSLHWSRTAPPVRRPAASRAPCTGSRLAGCLPADHPPTDPSGRHVLTSIVFPAP